MTIEDRVAALEAQVAALTGVVESDSPSGPIVSIPDPDPNVEIVHNRPPRTRAGLP